MQDSLEKAKNYAFLLLKFRPRSEKEIYLRLKKKKFDPRIIKEIISFLKEKDFINDNYFTSAWIELRLEKPFGLRRIKQELNLKGIDKEIIDSQIQQVCKNYSEEGVVTKLAQEKFKRLKSIERKIAKARIFSYLMHRGFSPDAIIDAINQL